MGEKIVIVMKDGNVTDIDQNTSKTDMNLHHWMHKFNNGISVDDTTITYKEHIEEDGLSREHVKTITLSEGTVESISKEEVKMRPLW